MSGLARATALALALSPIAAGAQPIGPAPMPVPPATPFEAPVATQSALRTLVEEEGRVVVTRRIRFAPIPLGGRSTVRVSAMGAFEPGHEESRLLGLRIDVDAPEVSEAGRTHYLDLHEIEALLRGMTLLDDVARDGRAESVTSADYETLEGFGVGLEVEGAQARWFVLTGLDGEHRVEATSEAILSLRETLEDARRRLFEG